MSRIHLVCRVLSSFLLVVSFSGGEVVSVRESGKALTPSLQEGSGDVLLHALIPLTRKHHPSSECASWNTGTQMLEALKLAVDDVNNKYDVIPTLALRVDVIDTCRLENASLHFAVFLSQCTGSCEEQALYGMVGAQRNVDIRVPEWNYQNPYTEKFLAAVHEAFPAGISDVAVNHDVMSTSPSTEEIGQGISKLITHYGWNYVTFVCEEALGCLSAANLQSYLRASGVCIAGYSRLAHEQTYTQAADEISRHPRAKVVVCFCSQRARENLQRKLVERGVAEQVTVISALGLTSPSSTLIGSLSLDVSDPDWEEFNNAVYNAGESSPIAILGTQPNRFVPHIKTSVDFLSHVLHEHHMDSCQGHHVCEKMATSRIPDDYYRVNFTDYAGRQRGYNSASGALTNWFDINIVISDTEGNPVKNKVGEVSAFTEVQINESQITWPHGEAPMSVCSLPCRQGERTVHMGANECCWVCVRE